MSTTSFEKQFIDYIEQTLSPSERERFEAELAANSELAKSFEQYKSVIQAERTLAQHSYDLSANFSVRVMDSVENAKAGFFRRLFMEGLLSKKVAVRSLATLATLVVVVKLAATVAERHSYTSYFNTEVIEVTSPMVYRGTQHESLPASGPVAAKQLPAVPNTAVSQNMVGRTLSAPVRPQTSLQKGKAEAKAAEALGHKEVYQDLEEDAGMALQAERGDVAQAGGARAFGQEGYALPYTIPEQRDAMQLADRDRESYRTYTENERIRVANESLSTFSIDVDTGSYTNVRRFLASGQLPPADAVRIEEFINYFDYNYPVQSDKPFAVYSEVAPSPLDKDHYLLKLGVKTRDAKQSGNPWNLVFLVDVSGSMEPDNRLPLVKRSLHMLTDKMRAQDRVSLVTYANGSQVILDSTPGSDKAKIHSAIDALSAGGSTNGSGGIAAAYQIAEKNKVSGVNRVILATDGDFNVGVTSFDDLVKMIEQKRESGITLTTVGVGEGNYQEATMEQLADKGNGNYFYLDGFKEARKVFETDLTTNMEVVAKDVKLQIEFNPNQVKEYRLIGYDNRKLRKEDFANDRIDAGEIGAGHVVTALYEFVPAKGPMAEKLETQLRYQKEGAREDKKVEVPANVSAELAFVKIRYKEPQATSSQLLEFPIESAQIKSDSKDTSDDFRFAAAVSYFGTLLRHSQFVGSYTYQDIIALAQAARGEDKQGLRQEFIELVKNAAAVSSGRATPPLPTIVD